MTQNNYSKPENFNIETVGEMKLGKTQDPLNKEILYGNGLQIHVPTTLNNCHLYLTHNNTTCYRISLFGL